MFRPLVLRAQRIRNVERVDTTDYLAAGKRARLYWPLLDAPFRLVPGSL